MISVVKSSYSSRKIGLQGLYSSYFCGLACVDRMSEIPTQVIAIVGSKRDLVRTPHIHLLNDTVQ